MKKSEIHDRFVRFRVRFHDNFVRFYDYGGERKTLNA